MIRRWDLWGALAGLAVGVADTWLLSAQGVEMRSAGRDATLLVGATFTSSLAILGFLSGSLLRARARARADGATIKRQLEALEVSQRVAFENEKLAAIGRLAAGIAHEVRNPLGVIRASASMIQESFQAGDESHRACQFICEEIDRLDGLITALLQFARPSELRVQSVALDKVIDSALQLADDDLRQREIEVIGRQTLGSLPEVQADPDLLAQLLLGLVTNAAEALERGGARNLDVGPKLGDLLPTARDIVAEDQHQVVGARASQYRIDRGFLVRDQLDRLRFDAVFEQHAPEVAPADELLTIEICRALHENHQLSPDVYNRAVDEFGEQGLVEMIMTIGYYTFVSMTLNAFEVEVAEGEDTPF